VSDDDIGWQPAVRDTHAADHVGAISLPDDILRAAESLVT
jgi:hypothetical protein